MKEEELFQQALERPADERAAFLRAACGDDESLRLRVEAILKAHEHPGSFLQSPAIPMSGREGPAEERASRTELLRTGERPNGMHWANTNGCTLLLTGATRDVFSGREFVVAESRRAGPA
jgi:hypothetical protein